MDQLRPFIGVFGDEPTEPGGYVCKRRPAKIDHLRFERRIGQSSINVLVEATISGGVFAGAVSPTQSAVS